MSQPDENPPSLLAVRLAELEAANQAYVRYIREKTNQLLEVMGTRALESEELDEEALIEMDPIGIVAQSFQQILAHLNQTIEELQEAKAGERELREFYLTEKMKLATLIESLSEGLLVLDEQNRVVSCNRAADEITQWLATDSLGKTLEALFPEMEAVLRKNACDLQSFELTFRSRQGADRLLSANVTRLRDSEGRAAGRVVTFRDSTEEKRRTELFHRTEKLAAIGQLSAGVAHELNTPLGSVLGYARLLLKDKTLSPAQRAWAEIIAEQVKKSSGIIQGLLRFARQSNPARRCLEQCRINEIIKLTLPLLATEMAKRKIELETDLQPLPPIIGDPRELEQVVLNLTMNALQAIGTKGRVRITTRHAGSRVVMKVEDNGPGIAEQIRSRIFDPFYTTKPLGEGTGLGLSICSGIVSDLGGTLDVTSVEGQGATFILSLPAATEASAELGKSDSRQAARRMGAGRE
ncbi:two-component system sensor histidine kinase NtrB [Geoalkalibacter halelectricus]|uniref:histidine kinase n=1 Tax=Geoalkalibacter halelectricus TaxID=2847045 RepID=A0ABY5ZPK3_9BACT|nr:ATP-binding protein [Geoalkalibacter halelectricus]MDO3379847.1 ATP-binding protein [Geoalkalibacter halelectricus]UWZ80621.1 ATP-binding protein [Geoalkalibacter halelectricus]